MRSAAKSRPYDALLLLSFGGPEGLDEVIPFLENVVRGRNVPRARLEEVAEHYRRFNGISPLNQQNRDLIRALRSELAAHGIDLPIYFGNRNWHPLLSDTLRQMAANGIKQVLTLVTSAYSSYSGCRQYREDLVRAQAELGPDAPGCDKIRPFYNHPGFIAAQVDQVQQALMRVPSERRQHAALVYTAHSIPLAMAESSDYVAQLQETATLIAEAVGERRWDLVYQSRSGPPQQPWLEPDIAHHLKSLPERGVQDVVIVPIGFLSDHMEVVFDLDVKAKERCDALGLSLIRAATVGTHGAFVKGLRQLIQERLHGTGEGLALGRRGPSPDTCVPGCCRASSSPGE